MIWAYVLWSLLALRFVAGAVRVRRALAAVPAASPGSARGFRLVRTPDAEIPEPPTAHAHAADLGVLHLMPETAPASYAWMTGFLLHSSAGQGGLLSEQSGTGYAMLVSLELLRKTGEDPDAVVEDPARFVVLARRLSRYGRTGIARVPGSVLRRDPWSDRAALEEALGSPHALSFVYPLVLGLVLLGLWVEPVAGLIALTALHLQPALALVGSPGKVPTLGLVVQTLLRWPAQVARWLAWMLQPASRLMREDSEWLRDTYADLVEDGIEPFFSPRRDDCPLCGESQLGLHLDVPDLWQGKRGRFHLERCGACGHIFQNPQLSIAGLAYYYRDFYDGLGGEGIEQLFGVSGQPYGARADLVFAHCSPSKWLDVGCGHGHFAHALGEREPGLHRAGLDLSDGVDDAITRGWIDEAHRGLFVDLAPSLAGRFDVVSMSHYLEHTLDPRAEIAAAATALQPGGHLLIEVPDPESRLARLLGRFWMPWFQPQHLHFVSVANLEKLLAEHGLEPLVVQRAEAHIPTDGLLAVGALMGMLSVDPYVPWKPRPGLLRRAWHSTVQILGLPLLLAAIVFDRLTSGWLARHGASNAYRVLARKA